MKYVASTMSDQPAHPLTIALIEALRVHPAAHVLEIGPGSGRNTKVLRAANLAVTSAETDPASHDPLLGSSEQYDAVLSTHALLHGDSQSLGQLIDAIATALRPGAPLYATFGSVRDTRFGIGTEIEPFVYAPEDGPERAVPHMYFDEPRLLRLLERWFQVDSGEEHNVEHTVGRWAHPAGLAGAVHWFVHARKRQ